MLLGRLHDDAACFNWLFVWVLYSWIGLLRRRRANVVLHSLPRATVAVSKSDFTTTLLGTSLQLV